MKRSVACTSPDALRRAATLTFHCTVPMKLDADQSAGERAASVLLPASTLTMAISVGQSYTEDPQFGDAVLYRTSPPRFAARAKEKKTPQGKTNGADAEMLPRDSGPRHRRQVIHGSCILRFH